MKKLKNEGKVTYEDLREVRCGVCSNRMWDKGDNVVRQGTVVCASCGTEYSFEPIAWRVFIK